MRTLLLKMAVRGGLTRCARPAGSSACGRSVQLAAPVVEPRSGVLIPPGWALYINSTLKLAPGGIDSLRSPYGQPGLRPVCPTGCASCRTPVGGSHPPQVGRYMRKKSPHINASFSSKMAVRGGFEPPIRCRIHTFQACSFSHSDTSPYCLSGCYRNGR